MSADFGSMLKFMSTSSPESYRGWLLGLDPGTLTSPAERQAYEQAVCKVAGAFGFLPEASFGATSDRAQFRCSLIQQGSRAVSPLMRLTTTEASALLPGLMQANLSTMTQMKLPKGQTPILNGIRAGKVRYERLDPNEHWQTWRELVGQIDRGGVAKGDCEDLSTSVAAELVYNGIPARPYVYQSGPKLYHVVVSSAPWGLLDPSRAAGMEGRG